MKLWKISILVLSGICICQQLVAEVPEELKQYIVTHHDATAAKSLENALQRAASSSTADAAQRAAKEVFRMNDEKAAAWLLSQPKLCGNAVIALKESAHTPAQIRAICEAVRNAAPHDGIGVFVEGDVDNPALIVANLKELLDSMLETTTPQIHRAADGQYHKGDVDRWLVQTASQVTTGRDDLKSALKDYVATAKLR